MITIKDNKVYLTEAEYKIIKGIYEAFRLDSYAVVLFGYGIKNGDLFIDSTLVNEDPKDFYYKVLSAVAANNYSLSDTISTPEQDIIKTINRNITRLNEEVSLNSPLIIKIQEVRLLLDNITRLKQLYDKMEALFLE